MQSVLPAFIGAFAGTAAWYLAHQLVAWIRRSLRRKPKCEICGKSAIARWESLELTNGSLTSRGIDLCPTHMAEQMQSQIQGDN